MSFYDSQTKDEKDKYREYLQIVGSLSNLFSDSNTPYLHYRIAEKMFCKAFSAKDLSRGDVSYDAQKRSLGVGLKTFLRGNNLTIQKIAEFNKDKELYENLSLKEKIIKISKLRNKRLEFTNNLYNIKNSIYHCVVRDSNRFLIFEEIIRKIDIQSIKDVKKRSSSIVFNDDIHEYSFSLSKSTLMKRFETTIFLDDFKVDILENPLDELYNLVALRSGTMGLSKIMQTIYLPLYGKGGKVFNSSGLNQWNAKGRARDKNEVYIPIPAEFHKYNSKFFPDKDTIFKLKLPNGDTIDAKLCQENSKALMSNPNKDLGKWILRDIFKIKEGELITNEILRDFGVDSVRIDKINELEYEINFAKTASYENFIKDKNEIYR